MGAIANRDTAKARINITGLPRLILGRVYQSHTFCEKQINFIVFPRGAQSHAACLKCAQGTFCGDAAGGSTTRCAKANALRESSRLGNNLTPPRRPSLVSQQDSARNRKRVPFWSACRLGSLQSEARTGTSRRTHDRSASQTRARKAGRTLPGAALEPPGVCLAAASDSTEAPEKKRRASSGRSSFGESARARASLELGGPGRFARDGLRDDHPRVLQRAVLHEQAR